MKLIAGPKQLIAGPKLRQQAAERIRTHIVEDFGRGKHTPLQKVLARVLHMGASEYIANEKERLARIEALK